MSNFIESQPYFWHQLDSKNNSNSTSSNSITLSNRLTEILREYNCINTNVIESAKLFELITNNSTDIIIVYNFDFSIKYISPSVKNVLGYEPYEIIGKKPFEIFVVEQQLNAEEPQILAYQHKFKPEKILLESVIKAVSINGKQDCYIGISRNVGARESIKNKLEIELEKEKSINENQLKYFLMTSHELKSPIATISSSLELLSIYLKDDEHLKKQQLEKHIERINGQLDRLNEIVNEVLVVEKTKATSAEIKLEKIDLIEFLKNLLDNSFSKYYPENISLKCKQEQVYLKSNNILLYHIFKNLIENAIKYSKIDKIKIKLIVEVTEHQVEVSVIDNGIGISPKDQHKLFNKFYRSEKVANISGFGLGLNIVKECASILNASLNLTSTINKGSCFKICFND